MMRDGKVVIPRMLRQRILERFHRGHQGVERCWRRARESVWWPTMRRDIEEFVERCNPCIKNRRVKHYPLQTTELQEGSWQTVG